MNSNIESSRRVLVDSAGTAVAELKVHSLGYYAVPLAPKYGFVGYWKTNEAVLSYCLRAGLTIENFEVITLEKMQ